jgi:hypothetical protein
LIDKKEYHKNNISKEYSIPSNLNSRLKEISRHQKSASLLIRILLPQTHGGIIATAMLTSSAVLTLQEFAEARSVSSFKDTDLCAALPK